MAKFENKDFFGDDFIVKVIRDANVLLGVLDELNKKMAEVATNQEQILNKENNQTIQSIKRTSDAIKTLNDVEKIAIKIGNDREKLELKLKELRSDKIQRNEQLKLQIQEQIKNNKALAKEALGLVSAFDKQKERLAQLRKEYKDLAVEEGENSERAEELLKDITALDAELRKIEKTSKGLVGAFQQQKNDLAELREEYRNLVTEQGVNAEGAEELLIQITRLDKQIKQTQKNSQGLVDEYGQQSARLNDLRRQYKSLILVQKESTEESEALLKEIKELDKALKDADAQVGQFQRNVGNYPKTTERAKRGLNSLSGFLLGIFVSSFQKSRAEAREFELRLESLKNTVSVVAQALIIFVTKQAIPAIENLLLRTERTFLNLKNIANEVRSFLGNAAAEAETLANNARIDQINKQLEENAKIIEETQNPFAGLSDRISESNELLRQQLIIEDELIDKTALLTQQIIRLTGEQERLNAVAGDTTRTFDEQQQAAEDALEVQTERLTVERQLATLQQDAAVLAVKNDLLRKQSLEGISDEQIRSLDILKTRQIADNVSIENIEKLRDATAALAEIENERLAFELEIGRTIQEIRRDRFERELDFAIDAFDAQKTVNERLIADERLTLEQRIRIFSETQRLTESSFQSQIKLVEEFTKQRIDLNELAQESDESVIRTRLEAFQFDDVTLGRILEIIRERKIALQDLADAQRDLNEAELEAIELRRDIIAQEEALQRNSREALEELEEQRLENEIDLLQERLEAVEQGSLEELRLRKELNDLLLAEQQRAFDEEDKLRAEQAEKAKQLREELIGFVAGIVDREFNIIIKNIDERIADSEQRANELIQKAQQGRTSAEESIAFERKQQDELERERERARKRQERTRALFAVLQSFNANDGNLPKTIADVQVLRAIADNLVGFYEGTDNTGKGGTFKDKDGRWVTGYTHENEMVLNDRETNKLKKAYGIESRDQLFKELAAAHTIKLSEDEIHPIYSGFESNRTDQLLANAFNKGVRDINKTVAEINGDTLDVDTIKKVFVHTKRRGNKIERTESKLY